MRPILNTCQHTTRRGQRAPTAENGSPDRALDHGQGEPTGAGWSRKFSRKMPMLAQDESLGYSIGQRYQLPYQGWAIVLCQLPIFREQIHPFCSRQGPRQIVLYVELGRSSASEKAWPLKDSTPRLGPKRRRATSWVWWRGSAAVHLCMLQAPGSIPNTTSPKQTSFVCL